MRAAELNKLLSRLEADHGRYFKFDGRYYFESGAILSFAEGSWYVSPVSVLKEDRRRAKRKFLETRAYAAHHDYETLREELRQVAQQCQRNGQELPPDFQKRKNRLPLLRKAAEEVTAEFQSYTEPERKRQESVEETLREMSWQNSQAAAKALEEIDIL